jgi:hypothetical protein
MTSTRAVPDAESRELDQALLDWIARAPPGFTRLAPTRAASYGLESRSLDALERRFEELALALFQYQYERVPAYRAFAQATDSTPSNVGRAEDVPALPVEAHRHTRVATFPPELEVARFHTSGTTGADPGTLHLDTLELYNLALERAFEHHVMPDTASMSMALLVSSPEESPHSSLCYMLDRVRQRWGAAPSRAFVRSGALQWPELRNGLERATSDGEPVCLLGTAFAFVQLLDAAAENAWSVRLPLGSRLFETGGYKGRSHELDRATLHANLSDTLGIPVTHMVSEYGMTELGSQYYTLSLRAALRREPPPAAEGWSAPFWLRARLMDSETAACRDSATAASPGLLSHHDLVNRGSVAHLLCGDLGTPEPPSFRLLGRVPRGDLRGCGLVHERAKRA